MRLATAAVQVFLLGLAGRQSLAQDTVLDTVVASEDHATLEAAVLAADSAIADTLSDPMANLTLFAPDDDAFGTLPEGTVDLLVTAPWQNHLNCVLLGHVYPDAAVPSSAITEPLTVASAQEGYDLNLDLDRMDVTVNDIPVSTADIAASNGIIHSLSEGVLLPSCVTENFVDVLSADENFSTLVELVTAADLGGALSEPPTEEGLTVMAPNNDAFGDVSADVLEYLGGNVTALTEVLTYHVIPANVIPTESSMAPTLNGDEIDVTVDGETITLNDSSEVLGTTLVSNGIIHEISAVLLPPSLVLPGGGEMETPMPSMMEQEGPTSAPPPTAESEPAPTPVPPSDPTSGVVNVGLMGSAVVVCLVTSFVTYI